MVDEDAGELIPDGALHQCRGNSRVDTARESADDQTVTHLLADARHLVVDDSLSCPRRLEARDVMEEALEHALAVLAVHDLGVELDAGEALSHRLHGGDRRSGTRCGDGKAWRRGRDAVAVRHPHRLPCRQAGEEHRTLVDDVKRRAAVLAQACALHRAAKRLRHRLEAVADTEDGHTGLEERGIDRGSPVGVDAARAA